MKNCGKTTAYGDMVTIASLQKLVNTSVQRHHRRPPRFTVQPQYRTIGIGLAKCVITLQDHPRLMIFVSSKKQYATSYSWSIAIQQSNSGQFSVEKRTFFLSPSIQPQIWKCYPCTASPKERRHRANYWFKKLSPETYRLATIHPLHPHRRTDERIDDITRSLTVGPNMYVPLLYASSAWLVLTQRA